MPDPSPLGDTRLLAIVRAICSPEPANVFGGGAVDSVFTSLTQRFVTPVSPAALEKLHGPFVPLRRGTCLEGSQIAPLSGLGVQFSRVQPVLAGLQFANHDRRPRFDMPSPGAYPGAGGA